MTQDLISLRDTADLLELDPLRLLRLAHYLHLAPRDQCLPSDVVDRARAEADGETRYRIVLDWLLEHLNAVAK